MKRLFAAAVFAAMSACAPAETPAFSPEMPVRSWALYYGEPVRGLADRLAGFDLVVVDPAALGDDARQIVSALHKGGAVVLGYLSAFEVASWHSYRTKVRREWFLCVDGKPWRPWAGTGVGWSANFAASLAESGWRDLLCEVSQRDVLGVGCDGLFLDTLEDLDRQELPAAERARQLDGLRELMRNLRRINPSMALAVNRTLGATLDVVAEEGADFVCWEDFSPLHFGGGSTRDWMLGVARRLRAAAQERSPERPLRVLALWNVEDRSLAADMAKAWRMMRAEAEPRGFVPYCLTGGYHSLPAAK